MTGSSPPMGEGSLDPPFPARFELQNTTSATFSDGNLAKPDRRSGPSPAGSSSIVYSPLQNEDKTSEVSHHHRCQLDSGAKDTSAGLNTETVEYQNTADIVTVIEHEEVGKRGTYHHSAIRGTRESTISVVGFLALPNIISDLQHELGEGEIIRDKDCTAIAGDNYDEETTELDPPSAHDSIAADVVKRKKEQKEQRRNSIEMDPHCATPPKSIGVKRKLVASPLDVTGKKMTLFPAVEMKLEDHGEAIDSNLSKSSVEIRKSSKKTTDSFPAPRKKYKVTPYTSNSPLCLYPSYHPLGPRGRELPNITLTGISHPNPFQIPYHRKLTLIFNNGIRRVNFPSSGIVSLANLLDALDACPHVCPADGWDKVEFKYGAVHIKRSAPPPWMGKVEMGKGKEPQGEIRFLCFWTQEECGVMMEWEGEGWWTRDVMVRVRGYIRGLEEEWRDEETDVDTEVDDLEVYRLK